ncbi:MULTISPECIES: type II secretion system protein [unclassified Sutcliffiella]|uniref:type IV pilus modification PilV family protein n=1 Tax=unclassified Sutcliffiella TaxID=2837532 RepID=UPI0030CF2B1B
MRINQRIHDQKGLTLIEILVSIVILGIIFTGMLGFFSQTVKYSSHNENKIISINLAEKMLSEYKASNSYTREHTLNGKDYYVEITELSAHQNMDLVPIAVKVYTDPSLTPTSLTTELYSYREDK